ncbi:SDR family NAD(P)-dependent oxidoreductase [Spongiactinospora sp. 9N601]|uniref:SDR family NAD(P)-dependent oxidoreductase n=1 Tax=Spongiactinospora sp. 9N601 TaxID=3375149 RepID=UPI0037B476CA
MVTGAGRGIGLAISRALADEGYKVVAGARTLTDDLRAVTPHVLQVDLATSTGAQALVDHAMDEFGSIDLLVNNVAGTSHPAGGLLDLDDAAWQSTFEATFFSAVRATRAAMPALLASRGAIVNIGSVNARLAVPRLVAYSAAKAALLNLGKALAEEFGGRGVRVNTISPGPVWTDIWTQPGGAGEALARNAGSSLEDFQDRFADVMGLSTGKLAEPEEIAALVVFLASGRVANMSGAEIVVDGGMMKTM